MSRKSSNRVNFSPDIYESPAILIKHKRGSYYNNKKNHDSYGGSGNWVYRILHRDTQLSGPVHFLRRLGDKTVRVLRFIGTGKSTLSRRSSNKVSSPSANLVRSRSLVDQSESHRAQAIEDCIEFLHSYSSTLQRSSSVSSTTC